MKLRLTPLATALALTATLAAPAFAANYATCVLDKMPGVANDVAAHSVYQLCLQEHPGGLAAVPQGSGRGFFGYDSGAECTAKKAGDTRSQRAAYIIGGACRKLYDEPTLTNKVTPKTQGSSAQEIHMKKIYAAHPDADEIYASSGFSYWIARTPEFKNTLSQGTTQEVIDMFSSYKREQLRLQKEVLELVEKAKKEQNSRR